MIFIIVAVLGLASGSFIHALLFRLHAEETGLAQKPQKRAQHKATSKDLSMVHGRSMCESCHTTLQARDLIPLFSWLSTAGKCRYCSKKIGWQAPVLELCMSALFVLIAAYAPVAGLSDGHAWFFRGAWMVFSVGLVAMAVYDYRYMLLPNRIILPLIALAVGFVAVEATVFGGGPERVRDAVLGLLVGGGIFYALFAYSRGRWIGGGDVKLGFFMGLILGPVYTAIALWFACFAALLYVAPLMVLGKMTRKNTIPFGPFLIAATFFTIFFGRSLAEWYNETILYGFF